MINNFIPNKDIQSPYYPLAEILFGGFLKYVVSGVVFDNIGHLLIFFGSWNFINYYDNISEKKLNRAIFLFCLVIVFLFFQFVVAEVYEYISFSFQL